METLVTVWLYYGIFANGVTIVKLNTEQACRATQQAFRRQSTGSKCVPIQDTRPNYLVAE